MAPRSMSVVFACLVSALVGGCLDEPRRLDCGSDVDVVVQPERDALFGSPEDPVGLLVGFHGLNESACNFVQKTDERRLVAAAMERGLAWVAPDGADAAWTVDLDSDEVGSVDRVIASLEDDGHLPSGLPTLVVGHSNGGAFAQVYGARSERDVPAAVNANGWGTDALGEGVATPPMLFVAAENDSVIPPSRVLEDAALGAGRGHDIETAYHTPVPFTAARAARVDGVDEDDGEAIVAAFRAANLLDPAGRPQVSPRTGVYGRELPARLAEHRGAIEDQVHVAYAEHRFSSDAVPRIFELWERALGR